MYQQSNLSLISITSDELRWLDADAMMLQDSSTTEPTTPPHSSANYGSATFPRHKNSKRHHYQRSTKSSSAKAVNRMSGSFSRRHSRSNLNYIVTPPVSVPSSPPTSPIECPPLTKSASLPIKTPPRLTKRTGSYSSTHGGSPGSEWIYRRPKSPSASSPPSASAIRYARRTASDSTASMSTPSPASTANNSRCVTPTSTTYRSGLGASYFPDVSTSCLNLSSTNLPAHLINSSRDANVNGSGSSVGSIGSIGVLVPSSFGFNSSVSNLSRQPSSGISKASSTSGESGNKTGTFWTSILHPRSGPSSASGKPEPPTSSRSSKGKQQQPSSPLAAHSATAIPSIWSGADLEGANGTSPKRRKGRGSLKELGISRIPQATSRITGNKSPSSPLSSSMPVYNTPVKRRTTHTRSVSISSASSSTTSSAAFSSASSLSSTPSSPPLTPVSPSFGIGKTKKFQPKFEPHHRVIVEVVEDDSDMDIQRRKSPSPTKSILASRLTYTDSQPPLKLNTCLPDFDVTLGLDDSLRKKAKRKDSVSTTISSNKSVKFVEQPTVHYASAIYESWDGTTGASPFDYSSMGMDLGDMDMDTRDDDDDDDDSSPSEETAHQHTYHTPSHPYASRKPEENEEEEANDTVSAHLEDFNSRLAHARALRAQEQARQREDACVTPTPDRCRERTSSGSTGTGSLKTFSLKRKSSSASSTANSAVKPDSSSSRPTISGPYALGSTSHPHPASLPALGSDSDTDVNELGLRGSGLRSAPSLESFKSMKSGKSMRSLKSLPESVKSSISLRAKGMKDWFKGRVTVSAM
ncbi:hypothetical protein BT96DRAFT_985062 [Gymnopus androsaceus JB14]|uniref:Uncharacterized protein n=1 Tax=Gymnopus androsaceus JB14 TaxID=1447944 RepID=A0A6A4IJG4_9AGAR|nr:hypothetical protein BT96DRAFT_985062 [Gymnopus androsaceus JB14]